MKSFVDVEILPHKGMKPNVLLNKTYSQFHLALCDLNTDSIGVSFPRYKIVLGNVLRIHGETTDIESFNVGDWLGESAIYTKITDVMPVPSQVSYRIISRARPNMTESKLRRLIKRKSLSAEDIKGYRVKMFSKGLDNPYVELYSQSTGQLYRRFLSFSDIVESEVRGKFDKFGLSATATVPWF